MENIYENLFAIIGKFNKMTAADITKIHRDEIFFHLQLVAKNFNNHTESRRFVMSSREKDFFYNIGQIIKYWLNYNIFNDRQVLRIIALTAIFIFLDKKLIRNSSLSYCKTDAGNLMLSLGFFEDAFNFHNQAMSYAYSNTKPYEDDIIKHIKKSLRYSIKEYRKSNQHIQLADQIIKEYISNSLTNIEKRIVRQFEEKKCSLSHIEKAEQLFESFFLLISSFLCDLDEMGFSKIEQRKLFKPIQTSALVLLNSIEKVIIKQIEYRGSSLKLIQQASIYFDAMGFAKIFEPIYKKATIAMIANQDRKYFSETFRDTCWWCNDLAILYTLIGDKKESLKWELKSLTYKQRDLKRETTLYLRNIKHVKNDYKNEELMLKNFRDLKKREKGRLIYLKKIKLRVREIQAILENNVL